MRSHYKRIGDYVTQIKLKNTDDSISLLKGININKHFMPSVANINGTDLSKYRVVKKNQFAFNPMHVGRDEVLPISMLEDDEQIIVSPAYVVFEVKDEEELLPAYLMMWCRRSEFDRNAWFMTDNSVRGGFSWADFCDMELPVPSIEKQREIVREYNVVNDRITLNEQLTQNLEDTAQAIYKQWFVDFEFPISKEYAESIGKPEVEGKPYKLSGGEMEYCQNLEKEIPNGWVTKSFKELATIKGGKRLPKGEALVAYPTKHPYIKVADLSDGKFCILGNKFEYLTEDIQSTIARYTVNKGDLIISIVGTIGVTKIVGDSLNGANLTENCVKVIDFKEITASFAYHFLKSPEGKGQLEEKIVGAVQSKLPIYNIESFKVAIPIPHILVEFNRSIEAIDKLFQLKQSENEKLKELKSTFLSKISRA